MADLRKLLRSQPTPMNHQHHAGVTHTAMAATAALQHTRWWPIDGVLDGPLVLPLLAVLPRLLVPLAALLKPPLLFDLTTVLASCPLPACCKLLLRRGPAARGAGWISL